ncbi:hypothetical protein OKW21_005427 [Catalinimonas alkaloidigena]|uniref:hypothetical protein n=1 Tax=Catalinimonas alkaloidigena TaxID=1075417 RepID=UPI0024057FBB|nr:hypothetical protein [Catalinimonas alkaloidigena]MDF9800164.1 hypothetical protein [Catalinimonas alkaloidigena]
MKNLKDCQKEIQSLAKKQSELLSTLLDVFDDSSEAKVFYDTLRKKVTSSEFDEILKSSFFTNWPRDHPNSKEGMRGIKTIADNIDKIKVASDKPDALTFKFLLTEVFGSDQYFESIDDALMKGVEFFSLVQEGFDIMSSRKPKEFEGFLSNLKILNNANGLRGAHFELYLAKKYNWDVQIRYKPNKEEYDIFLFSKKEKDKNGRPLQFLSAKNCSNIRLKEFGQFLKQLVALKDDGQRLRYRVVVHLENNCNFSRAAGGFLDKFIQETKQGGNYPKLKPFLDSIIEEVKKNEKSINNFNPNRFVGKPGNSSNGFFKRIASLATPKGEDKIAEDFLEGFKKLFFIQESNVIPSYRKKSS